MIWNKAKRSLAALLLTVVLLMSCAGGAFAAMTEEYGAKYLKSDDLSVVDVDIIDFKVRLYELGFYSAGVGSDTLQTKELDDLTMAAVKLVCTYNPDLVFYPDGVTNLLYWRVMGINTDGKGLVTPSDEVYSVLVPGETSENVTKVQNRLNALGYDGAGYTFTPGVYDDELQGAVDAFVRCNKFVYTREEGITIELQELLFSDDAIAYAPDADPLANAPLSQKVFTFLKAKSSIFGIALPNYVQLIIGFVLLCVIVLLIMHLAGGKKSDGAPKPDQTGGKLKAGQIEFRIEYKGNSCTHIADMSKYVRIGRATGDFPLDLSDESISRKHCEICNDGGSLMLRDFSSYGTKVNGTMCHHSQQALHSGDVIEVGNHRITIKFQK